MTSGDSLLKQTPGMKLDKSKVSIMYFTKFPPSTPSAADGQVAGFHYFAHLLLSYQYIYHKVKCIGFPSPTPSSYN